MAFNVSSVTHITSDTFPVDGQRYMLVRVSTFGRAHNDTSNGAIGQVIVNSGRYTYYNRDGVVNYTEVGTQFRIPVRVATRLGINGRGPVGLYYILLD